MRLQLSCTIGRNRDSGKECKMEILGTVQGGPVLMKDCCLFSLEGNEGLYLILSTDRQAVKDHIFIGRGQEVQITGNILEQENFRGIFITERSKIKIKNGNNTVKREK